MPIKDDDKKPEGKVIVLKRPENYQVRPPEQKPEPDPETLEPIPHCTKIEVVKPSIYDILDSIEEILATQLIHMNNKSKKDGLLGISDQKAFRCLVQNLIDLNKEAREQRKANLLEGMSDQEVLEEAERILKRMKDKE